MAAQQPVRKVRGPWLTAMLIFIAVHAVFTAVLLISYHKNPGVTREVLWAGAFLVALLEIASVAVMWFWKKWGLYLFVAATLASIGFGLVIYPSMLVAFHAIIPLGILAYILQAQDKLKLFE